MVGNGPRILPCPTKDVGIPCTENSDIGPIGGEARLSVYCWEDGEVSSSYPVAELPVYE